MIKPEKIAEVGNPVIGIVESVFVKPGDIVKKDSTIPSGLRCKVKLPEPVSPVIRNDSEIIRTPYKISAINARPSNIKYASYVAGIPLDNHILNATNTMITVDKRTSSDKSKFTKSLSTNAQGAALQTFKIKPAKTVSSANISTTPTITSNMKWEPQLNSLEQSNTWVKPKVSNQ